MIARAFMVGMVAGFLLLTVGAIGEAHASSRTAPAPLTPAPTEVASAAPTAAPSPVAAPTPTPPPSRSTSALQARIGALAAAAGSTQVAVALVELDGSGPLDWSTNGDVGMTAASTYKLPLLMAEAQAISAGTATSGKRLTYTDSEYEDGWYDDYSDGDTFTLLELARRTGQQSDNTAARMLVDSLGGAEALNAYAAGHGATDSAFYDPNTTTANDLARLWVNEAAGQAGGAAAQQWLYPLLTRTSYESGIPAGVGSGATVVHKIGAVDSMVSDAALVEGGPKGNYVLVVMTDGPGGDDGWALVASISKAVWEFEAAR
jgi:beta-lactamase class A